MLERFDSPAFGVRFNTTYASPCSAQNARFFGDVAIFVHRVHVGLQPCDVRFGVHPAVPRRDQRLGHVADRADHVAALVLGLERMAFAFEVADVGVVPHRHEQVAQFRDFLEEADVAGVKPVVAAGDDDGWTTDDGRRRMTNDE